MLAKVNELNKNVVVLLSVLIIAITSIVVTLIATSEGSSKGSANSLRDFQQYFIAEYGVKPQITIKASNVSESTAKTITNKLSKQLDLGKLIPVDYDGKHWYSANNDDETIYVDAFYK